MAYYIAKQNAISFLHVVDKKKRNPAIRPIVSISPYRLFVSGPEPGPFVVKGATVSYLKLFSSFVNTVGKYHRNIVKYHRYIVSTILYFSFISCPRERLSGDDEPPF